MQNWLTVEILGELVKSYQFVAIDLIEMRKCWDATKDLECSPDKQRKLEDRLVMLYKEMQKTIK